MLGLGLGLGFGLELMIIIIEILKKHVFGPIHIHMLLYQPQPIRKASETVAVVQCLNAEPLHG